MTPQGPFRGGTSKNRETGERNRMKPQETTDRETPDKATFSTLEELLPKIVYQLNSHLTSVIGYGELLLPKLADPGAREDLQKMIEEAQQTSQMIKDLVLFAGQRKPRMEPLNLNASIEAALQRKASELNLKNITLVKELSLSLPYVKADPIQIEQVLSNLITNAEEAISKFHGFGEIRVNTKLTDTELEIRITDDGPGIPADHISNIFDPFVTTKEKGIGLGLTISKSIILNHGGSLRVESEWGKGTTILIRLPLTKSEVKSGEEKGGNIEEGLQGMKGLVIDDDPDILHLVSQYLRYEGSEITTASDAQTALYLIESQAFDFVVCDLRMPETSGMQLYSILLEKEPSLKDRLVFITGDVLNDETKSFIDSVSCPYLEKPFPFSSLKEILIKFKKTTRDQRISMK